MSGKQDITTLVESSVAALLDGHLVKCDYCPALVRVDRAITQFLAIDVDQTITFCSEDCANRWNMGKPMYGDE